MKAIDIIEKKKNNEKLEYKEIEYMVNSYVKGKNTFIIGGKKYECAKINEKISGSGRGRTKLFP